MKAFLNTRQRFRRLSDVLGVLVDDRVGIVRRVVESPRQAGAPDFFHYYAQASNTSAFCQQENFPNTGGASAIREVAIGKAVGEAVERYCSAIFDVEEFPLTAFEDASFACVSPEEFSLYAAHQTRLLDFPWVPFNSSTKVRWAPAIDLMAGSQCYVPAGMVYVPYYYYIESGDNPIVQPMSTGLACHCSLAEAAISAICEVIERDAFTITWQAMLSMPKINLESLSEANLDLVHRFEQDRCSVTLLNITLDNCVPTILGILSGRSPELPSLVFAASSEASPESAVRKTLEELAHTRRYAKQIKDHFPPVDPNNDYASVTDQVSHLNLYSRHENAHLADFLFSSDELIDFSDIEALSSSDVEQTLDAILVRIQSTGHRVLLANLTTPDVGEIGLSVVRAIIPGYHPLFVGHRIRALGGERLWSVPQRLGYIGISRESGDNPHPHGYP